MPDPAAKKRNSILKVILYWLLFLALLIPVASQSGALLSKPVNRFAVGIFGTAIALFVSWIFIRWDKASFKDYWLVWQRDTLTKFGKGLMIGVASFLFITLILVLFGGLSIKRNPAAINPWIGFWYLAIIPAALMEEIAFRGYPFLKLQKAFGLRVTQCMVLIAFALYHIPFGWSPLTAFLGPGIWSLIFGIAVVRSKGIALSTGIHVGLNLVLSILGMSKGVESFFITSQNESTSNTIANLATRFLVLLAGILLTEWHLHQSKKENESKQLDPVGH